MNLVHYRLSVFDLTEKKITVNLMFPELADVICTRLAQLSARASFVSRTLLYLMDFRTHISSPSPREAKIKQSAIKHI